MMRLENIVTVKDVREASVQFNGIQEHAGKDDAVCHFPCILYLVQCGPEKKGKVKRTMEVYSMVRT